MTLTLAALSDNEYEIYKRTQQQLNSNVGAEGDLQDDKLILDNYKAIHRYYLRIFYEAQDEATKLEALKRLVFLNWNLIVETDWLTGIDALDELVINEAYSILERYMEEGKFDVELSWMLSHYAVWDYAILQYAEGKLPALTRFVETIEKNKKKFPRQLPAGTFDNRGQMGIYWNLMIKTEA
ncbi:hypothetical protein [Mucilaginibacter pedocola]|uniref:Uncharacterized protein n=1 Tax=Mucilaginibacter pedocola TaxID=1792845 RepID=A0A1S9P986_9SPHI|nr:hypothetical protein [Mucilaginibacter pedocola]OOQ57533.1 hypothetical protein BC343_12030 [Mucilaginibacter pedocola]